MAAKQKKHKVEANNTRGKGFALAVVCYSLLGFMLSLTPAHAAWWLLAVGAVPVFTGAMAAKGTSQFDTPRQRFSSGFWTCSLPMFVYVAISLMVAHGRVGPSGNAGGTLLIGALAACVYTLLAGIVAGMAGVVCYLQANRQGETA